MLYKLSVKISREDGFEQETYTHHDPTIVKNEEAFMTSFYNNTVQLWTDLEVPTSKELDLQRQLDQKQKYSNVAWAMLIGVCVIALATMLWMVNS